MGGELAFCYVRQYGQRLFTHTNTLAWDNTPEQILMMMSDEDNSDKWDTHTHDHSNNDIDDNDDEDDSSGRRMMMLA
jgi:hypothetical protein